MIGRTLNELLDANESRGGFSAVEQAVVVGQGDDHDGSDLDLAVDNPRLLLDGVHAEHSGLGQVDDGGTEEGTKDTAVGAAHRNREKRIQTPMDELDTYMVKVPPVMSSRVSLLSLAFLPSSAIDCSISRKDLDSQFLTTGVTRPLGVATATLMST